SIRFKQLGAPRDPADIHCADEVLAQLPDRVLRTIRGLESVRNTIDAAATLHSRMPTDCKEVIERCQPS
ncbi:MAG: hypothetical protein M3P51_18130, partial [Chloroflexota bacterium]|nr:hypothetical protein [Chloroflexota bacterium]